MSYPSIDVLQKALADSVFADKADAKKAAGRALGTIVEIITYYLLREWGLTDCICIETRLPEYGNREITHNVEFTLHRPVSKLILDPIATPVTATKLLKFIPEISLERKSQILITTGGIVKNSCLAGENDTISVIANVEDGSISLACIERRPFAMFECKRVGVEEGQTKGPQTIEKAKQGAYVAIKTSALQKIRNGEGELTGIYFRNGQPMIGEYEPLLDSLLEAEDTRDIILTFGIISNHGNWFTSDDMNKEMKVLAQSYDRLLFLTDNGLAQFIIDTILEPEEKYRPIREAFLASYSAEKKGNVFTKSKIDISAHNALCSYFGENISTIEGWFNIISPASISISRIKEQLIKIAHEQI